MEEFFKSLKEDFERARALWILNNLDLIEGYAKVKIYVSRLSADGAFLPDATLPVCQDSRAKL